MKHCIEISYNHISLKNRKKTSQFKQAAIIRFQVDFNEDKQPEFDLSIN